MGSFKKIISLNQAAQFSGYTQDYLGFLIRTGELKGIKKGRTWFTTKEEIENYIFKKKIRNQEFALREFFSFGRFKNIIIATIIIFIGCFFVFSEINKSKLDSNVEIQSAINSDGEGIIIN